MQKVEFERERGLDKEKKKKPSSLVVSPTDDSTGQDGVRLGVWN